MVFADTYLQPDAPDPVLAQEVVLAAARRHAPQAGRLLEVDESGGEARAYLLEGGIVMKTQRPHRLRPRTSLAKEQLFLTELEHHGDFAVPQALGHGEMEGIEYLCLTRLDGCALENAAIDPAQRRQVLARLGQLLRAIHEVDQSVLGTSELLPGDRSPADLAVRISASFERLAGMLNADERFRDVLDVPRIAAECLRLIPTDIEPIALHSNPGPEHTFVEPRSGLFTGLIDFGDAYRSHPALDLRPWTDPSEAEAVLTGYASTGPLPRGFEEVWRTGLVLVELSRASRGRLSPDELAAALDRILG